MVSRSAGAQNSVPEPDSSAFDPSAALESPADRGLGRLGRGMALAYALCFGVTLWVAYHGHLPTGFQRIPNYDKLGHVILYAIATYLGHRRLNRRHVRLSRWLNGRFSRYQLPLFPLLFTLFTIVEELSQGFSPNRTLDALDLVCSLVGVGLGYGLAQRSPQKSTRKGQ